MSRRRTQHDNSDSFTILFERFKTSEYFAPYAKKFEAFLHLSHVKKFLEEFLPTLPTNNNAHWYEFDWCFIQDILDEWDKERNHLSKNIFPIYAKNWAFLDKEIQLDQLNNRIRIEAVYFDRSESEKPFLEEYVWLIHELGHHLLKVDFRDFQVPIEHTLNAAKLDMEFESITARGVAQKHLNASAELFSRVWKPSGIKGWTLELCIDALCIWMAGPAYIAAFVNVHKQANPYQIDDEHPPVELRLSALLESAKRLGWTEYTLELEQLRTQWYTEYPDSLQKHPYRVLRHQPMMSACIETTFGFCEKLQLQRLTAEILETIKTCVQLKEPLYGTQLIIGAWFAERLGEAFVTSWEELQLTLES